MKKQRKRRTARPRGRKASQSKTNKSNKIISLESRPSSTAKPSKPPKSATPERSQAVAPLTNEQNTDVRAAVFALSTWRLAPMAYGAAGGLAALAMLLAFALLPRALQPSPSTSPLSLASASTLYATATPVSAGAAAPAANTAALVPLRAEPHPIDARTAVNIMTVFSPLAPASSIPARIPRAIVTGSIGPVAVQMPDALLEADSGTPEAAARQLAILKPALAAPNPIDPNDLLIAVYRAHVPDRLNRVRYAMLSPPAPDGGEQLTVQAALTHQLSMVGFARSGLDLASVPLRMHGPGDELDAKRQKSKGGVKLASLGAPPISGNTAAPKDELDERISKAGHVSTRCIPKALKRVLNQIVARHGPIYITSTHRSASHNRRVGGARNSMHLQCRAIDFKFHGSNRRRLLSFLDDHPAVGGLGNYGSGGHIHIDDGPHRRW